MPRIEWSARALRELGKLDRPIARRVLAAVSKLGSDPRPAGTRPLVGQPAGTMRLRVGDYRVVYTVQDEVNGSVTVTVTVVRVAHRRDVYRQL